MRLVCSVRTVSWRVQADPAAGVGGLSALFLQALHPLAMAGVLSTPALTPIFGHGLPGPRSTSPRLLLAPPVPWRVCLLTPARPAWAALGASSFCLMPRWARRLYRLPGLATTDMGATLALWALRSAAMRVPERYRVGPLVLAARQRAAHQVLPTA